MRKNHRFRTWNIQIRSYFIHSSIQFTKNINIHVVICKPVTGKLRGSLYNITISRVIPNNLYKCYIRLAYISSCLRFHQNACNWIMWNSLTVHSHLKKWLTIVYVYDRLLCLYHFVLDFKHNNIDMSTHIHYYTKRASYKTFSWQAIHFLLFLLCQYNTSTTKPLYCLK